MSLDALVTASAREELLTIKEYAAVSRRHPQTVYTAIREGRLPYPVVRPTGGGLMVAVPSAVLAKLRAA